MAEFSAVANLDIVPTGIDAAKREIERELGDLEVGVSANRPTGGAIGSRGPEPAGIDISRRQLGQQEQLVELAQERNELLDELLEGDFGGGGGGGGGFGLGFASRGILGGVAGGIGASAGLSSLALAGLPLAGGFLGQQGNQFLRGQFPDNFVDVQGENIPGTQFTREGLGLEGGGGQGAGGIFENLLGFFGGLEVPERGTTDRRQVTEESRREAITNNITIDSNVNVDARGPDERELQNIVDRKNREMRQEILNFIDRTVGGGTDPRTIGDPGGATRGPTAPGPGPV